MALKSRRRTFVAAALLVAPLCVALLAVPVSAQTFKPKAQTLVGPELTEREKTLQALNRLAFGPRPGEVDEVLKKEGGWQAWVKAQLAPDTIDDGELDKRIAKDFSWAPKASITDFEKAVPTVPRGKQEKATLKNDLPKSLVVRAALSKREFKEVICEFWRNHFCVDLGPGDEKSREWTAGHYEEQVIRKHAFGKFKQMLFASATHPAMLEYLDNQLSRANAWNENYAREVMELHTLGADRGYTNTDVVELSKVLTGWRYDNNYRFGFDAGKHQPGTKHVLGVNIPEGYQSGEQCLYGLAVHPYTAEFIATKLCKYFINDNPPKALVTRVASVFRQSEGDLPKVYAAVINSPEFMSRENFRSKFKTPFEFTVSALRITDAKVDDAGEVCKELRKMGEPLYDCPDPTGYRDVAESWMDAGVLTSRWDFAWNMLRGEIKGIHVPGKFVDQFKSLEGPERLQKMIDEVVGGDIGDREKKMDESSPQRMLSILIGSPSFQQQ